MRGFIYYFAGAKHAVQLLVSIASLRRWGNEEEITICCGDDEAQTYADKIVAETRLGSIKTKRISLQTGGEARRGKARQHCGKAAMGDWTPYDKTIFLDADTLVCANLHQMWPSSEEIVLTQFATWQTTGGKLRKRLQSYRSVLPKEVALMCGNPYPAINTGALAWDRNTEGFHRKWKEICLTGEPVFMGDEIVANLIFLDFKHRVLSDLWNFSPVYSIEGRNGEVPKGIKIWHYHGGKHCRRGPAIESWWSGYEFCLQHNFAHVNDWTPARDKSLRKAIEERRSNLIAALTD